MDVGERSHRERDVFLLQRLQRTRMDDAGSEVAQLDGFAIADVRQQHGVWKAIGIGVEHPGNVLPDRTRSASSRYAKMAALKSDPSRPSVVVVPSGAPPMKPCVNSRRGWWAIAAHAAGARSDDRVQSIRALRYRSSVATSVRASAQVFAIPQRREKR